MQNLPPINPGGKLALHTLSAQHIFLRPGKPSEPLSTVLPCKVEAQSVHFPGKHWSQPASPLPSLRAPTRSTGTPPQLASSRKCLSCLFVDSS